MADVDDLLVRLARHLASVADSGGALPDRLCRAAVDTLGCDGGAITLAYTHVERVTLSATDDTALLVEEAQDVMGQGPGHDAYGTGTYTRFDLLDVDGPDPRWPLLESEVLTSLAPLVIHAVPMLQKGDRVMGVLTLYQRGTGLEVDVESALIVARVTATALLSDGPSLQGVGQGPWAERAEVHQATGMVVAQLGIHEEDALALLRAHAYSHDQSLGATAHAVVIRELSFSANPDQEIEST